MPWDVVHACWRNRGHILSGAELAFAVPRTARFVFRTAQSLNKTLPAAVQIPFERFTLGRAAGWICSGRLVAANLLRRQGYPELPMACIPLGVDLGSFHPDVAAGVAVRRELGWTEPGPPVVGYLGRFAPEKGLTVLMHALDALRTPWRALLVGAGPMEKELRGWAARQPDDRVRICTNVAHDAVPRYLNAMDTLVAPSQTTPRWKEQFGRMLIEAMACGVPVVGSDSGEIPHVLAGVGEVVSESDIGAWTQKLGEVLDSPDHRAKLAAQGLDACHRYSWDEVARQHLDFFGKLLDTRR